MQITTARHKCKKSVRTYAVQMALAIYTTLATMGRKETQKKWYIP